MNWDFEYNINEIFQIFISELKLKNYKYIHDLNNVFLDTSKFTFVEYLEPDYKYLDIKIKNVLFDKEPINTKYNNDVTKISNNKYFRVYDSGYKLLIL